MVAVGACYAAGMSPEEMAENFPSATLAKIYAGIAYYLANREHFDAEIAEELELERVMAARYPHGWTPETRSA